MKLFKVPGSKIRVYLEIENSFRDKSLFSIIHNQSKQDLRSLFFFKTKGLISVFLQFFLFCLHYFHKILD